MALCADSSLYSSPTVDGRVDHRGGTSASQLHTQAICAGILDTFGHECKCTSSVLFSLYLQTSIAPNICITYLCFAPATGQPPPHHTCPKNRPPLCKSELKQALGTLPVKYNGILLSWMVVSAPYPHLSFRNKMLYLYAAASRVLNHSGLRYCAAPAFGHA